MPPTSKLRSPDRFRALVASGADARISDMSSASLQRMLVATQLVVLFWSIARIAFDGWHRTHHVETDLALVIAAAMTLALATKGLRWLARRGPHLPPPGARKAWTLRPMESAEHGRRLSERL